MSISTSPTVYQSLKLLKSYSCLEPKLVHSEAEKVELQQAIKQIVSLSEYENLGICADSSEIARQALNQYLNALGYEAQLDQNALPSQENPIYLKFNTQRMSHYLDGYDGQYRGVLISCQSEDDNITGTYGYFPLDLFKN
ncbi:MAG: DUF1824 family protein [Snowella sp.]|nr:DUF1824 family protein [Snowella sp.]